MKLEQDLKAEIARKQRRVLSESTDWNAEIDKSKEAYESVVVYKANKGFSQLAGVLNFCRSGSNLICKPGNSKSARVTRIRRNFINERVMLSWNKLPSDVKNSESLDIFKSNLELFKSKTRALGISGCGNYWEISDEVLNRIEAGSYLENKMRHNEYLKDNPLAANKKFINLH